MEIRYYMFELMKVSDFIYLGLRLLSFERDCTSRCQTAKYYRKSLKKNTKINRLGLS